MNQLLYIGLEEFLRATMEAINCLELEDFDKLEEILNKRNNAIEKLSKLVYSSEEFASIVKELDLMKFDINLKALLEEKQAEIKSKIGKLRTAKKNFNNYNPKNYVDSFYFNKKI